MTNETERRIRSLAANVLDLNDRIVRLDAELRAKSDAPLEARQQMAGDLAVAYRVHYEANAELIEFKNTHREV